MMTTQDMTFSCHDITLAGTLHLPRRATHLPAIVMVHGSGATDRDSGGFFPPIREFFLEQGVAVLSWDKPGIGESTGDWRRQTIRERAEESAAAIAWLRSHEAIDPQRVGCWGHSQGGWIGPMVAASDPDLWLLVIHSGTGVPVEEQDFFGLRETMRRSGASDEELAAGRAYMDSIHEAARNGLDHANLREAILTPARGTPHFDYFGEIDAAEWEFFLLNFAPNAVFDPIEFLSQVRCPTLAIFGEHDRLVPVQRSVEILNETMGKSASGLVIEVFPNGNHRLGNDDGTDGFVPGYFEFMREWIATRMR